MHVFFRFPMNSSPRDAWRIRSYVAGDRAAVRGICCDTANVGQPLETFFSDRVLAADLLMNYYTDYEPMSLLVVEQGGVQGYLAGCRDTRRFLSVMKWRIAPWALFKAFWKGTWWSAPTRRLLRWNLPLWRRFASHSSPWLAEYPAHLHVNLHPAMRGQGIGHELIGRFLGQLRASGIRGVHLSARADNIKAIAFFEQLGFRRVGQRLFMRLGPEMDAIRYSVIMAKSLK